MLATQLNDLLISLNRSLVQYAGESWLWSGKEHGPHAAAAQETVKRIVHEQQAGVTKLAALLDRRHHVVDFGAYPTDYTSLHYVALKYLLSRITANQAALVEDCRRLAGESSSDPEAKSVLDSLLESEGKHLEQLRVLSAERQVA